MPPSFFNTSPPCCGVILASSLGKRLFPLTTTGAQESTSVPKHLLPVGGIAPLGRLLQTLVSFQQLVITISHDDSKTLDFLKQVATLQTEGDTSSSSTTNESGDGGGVPTFDNIDRTNNNVPKQCFTFESKYVSGQSIHVVQLSEDCIGSVDALRQVEETKIVHSSTRLVVFPGDVVFLTTPDETTKLLDSLMRPSSAAACTALLVDVVELDGNGVPLKEDAKAKRGGLGRDAEDIEYIGLSYENSSWYDQPSCKIFGSSAPQRLVIKKPKNIVETDTEMTGSTFKLDVPKSLLRSGNLVVRTEWSDLHVYSFQPWVRKLIAARTPISSIHDDLLPLLVSRQFRGQRATFGSEGMSRLLEEQQNISRDDSSSGESNVSTTVFAPSDKPYSVLAVPLPSRTAVRSNTISSYFFANKESIAKGSTILPLPKDSKWNGKFHSLVLANDVGENENVDTNTASTKESVEGEDNRSTQLQQPTIGKKVQMKSCFVGKNCFVGDKCRLNNVIVLDNARIGEQCSLQNTVVGYGATIGPNTSLSDCQVESFVNIPSQTKEKNEVFTASDDLDSDGMLW